MLPVEDMIVRGNVGYLARRLVCDVAFLLGKGIPRGLVSTLLTCLFIFLLVN